MSAIEAALTKIGEAEEALKQAKRALAAHALSGAPMPEDVPPEQGIDPTLLIWRKGDYGYYAFRKKKSGDTDPIAEQLVKEILAEPNSKLVIGGYTYTYKEGSNFINRRP